MHYPKKVLINKQAFAKYIAILFLVAFCQQKTLAQKLKFEHLTVEEGLQNNIVLAAAEDAKGLMWFATSTGIDRYDGNRAVRYAVPAKDGKYIQYSQISYVIADSKKQIWAASANGIYKYNVEKDKFVLNNALVNWLEKGRSVTGLSTGNDNKNLLIGNNNGLAVCNNL
jgi:ligand-binding sensor domain-containing protein